MHEYLNDRSVVIFGYGSQGRSHALNLQDSGVNVSVCLPVTSDSIAEVKSSGFTLLTDPVEAAKKADVAALLVPDSAQKELYGSIEGSLPQNASILFAHGMNIHYGLLKPREDLDVVLVAPLAQGDEVRRLYLEKAGLPVLIAVSQNVTGRAWQMVRAYSAALGAHEDTMLESTFREETETDLFAEQSLIVGGIWRLITTAFETLVEEGYSPETAYYCCLKETKIMSDMFARLGIMETFRRISDAARFGALSRGPRIIDEHVKEQMKKTLKEIQDGKFAKEFEEEQKLGRDGKTVMMMEKIAAHTLETIHRRLKRS